MTYNQVNPFPGLRPFDQEETHLFFGREKQIGQLVERLRRTRFLAIVGASGCGKSSLIRAGLLPTLLAENQSPLFRAGVPSDLYGDMSNGQFVTWRMAILRPGDSPLSALANALSHTGVLDDHWQSGQREVYTSIVETSLRHSSLGLIETVKEARLPETARLLILVDQFEELFRFPSLPGDQHAGDEAKAFVDLLLNGCRDPVAGIYVILTMRSDYLGQCMLFSGLPEAISNSQYLVPRLSRNELRASITGPIEGVGETVSPRLVSRLLNQLGDDQDQLPILQHALMRLWASWYENRTEKGSLDIQHLQETHPLQTALGEHAEEVFSSLHSEEQQDTAGRIFKILTETNADGQGIRRPVSLDLLCSITGMDLDGVIQVIERFRAPDCCFLMPPIGTPLGKNTVIDISHESLMRTWPRLKQWIQEEEDSARCYRRCLDTALQWKKGKGGLWDSIDSPELDFALSWKEINRPNADWASLYTSGREIAKAIHNYNTVTTFLDNSNRERQNKRREIAREIRVKKWKKRGVKVLALAFIIILAVVIVNNSQHEKMIVEEKNAVAKLFIAQNDPDPLMQALYLLNSDFNENQPEAKSLIHEVSFSYLPYAIHRIPQEVYRSFHGINKIAISPAETKIAIGTITGGVLIWDWQQSGNAKQVFKNHESTITGLTYTNNGNGLVSSYSDGTVRYHDVKGNLGDVILFQSYEKVLKDEQIPKPVPVRSLAISPTDDTIVFGLYPSSTQKKEVLSLTLSEKTLKGGNHGVVLEELDSPAYALSVGPGHLISGSKDGSLNLMPLTSNEESTPLTFKLPVRNSQDITFVSLAQNGDGQIAIGSEDGLIYMLAPKEAEQSLNYNKQNICINEDPSLQCPFTFVGYNCTTLKPDRNFGNVVGVGFWNNMTYGGYEDGVVRVWQCNKYFESYRPVISLTGHQSPIVDVALDAKNNVMVSTDSQEIRVWDLNQFSNDMITSVDREVIDLEISPVKDVSYYSAAGADGFVTIFEINEQWEEQEIIQAGYHVKSFDLGKRGDTIVTGSKDGTLTIWSAGAGWKQSDSVQFNEEILDVVYDSSRGRVFFATENGVMVWVPGNAPVPMDTEGKAPSAIALSEDETMLVAGDNIGGVKVWTDLDKGTAYDVGTHGSEVNKVDFFDENQVLSGGDDGRICLWNIESPQKDCRLVTKINESGVTGIDVFTDNDEKMIVVGGDKGEIKLIKINEGVFNSLTIGAVKNGVSSVKFYKKAKIVLSAGEGVRKWPLENELIIKGIRERTFVCFTPDQRGKYLFESSQIAKENYKLCKKKIADRLSGVEGRFSSEN